MVERISLQRTKMARCNGIAKIIVPPKGAQASTMMHVRPITILSLLWRVLSKTWTRKALKFLEPSIPWQLQGSLPGREPMHLWLRIQLLAELAHDQQTT